MGDVRLVDETGTVVAEVQGARLWYLAGGAAAVMDDTLARRLYAIQWRPAPVATDPVRRPRPLADLRRRRWCRRRGRRATVR